MNGTGANYIGKEKWTTSMCVTQQGYHGCYKWEKEWVKLHMPTFIGM
jgi:hypothetical protein